MICTYRHPASRCRYAPRAASSGSGVQCPEGNHPTRSRPAGEIYWSINFFGYDFDGVLIIRPGKGANASQAVGRIKAVVIKT